MIDKERAGLLFAGAIIILMGALVLVGKDYHDTRSRSQDVPLLDHRMRAVETSIKEASQEQARSVRELAAAVVRLEQTIIRIEERQSAK